MPHTVIMRETADVIWGMKTENKEHVIYYSDKPFQATLLAVADFMVASVYNFLYWLGKNIYVTFKKHVWIWIFCSLNRVLQTVQDIQNREKIQKSTADSTKKHWNHE